MALTIWHSDFKAIPAGNTNFTLPAITDNSLLLIFAHGSNIGTATGCTLDHSSLTRKTFTRLVTAADSGQNVTVNNAGSAGVALLVLISGGEQVKPATFTSGTTASTNLGISPPGSNPPYPVVRFMAHLMLNNSHFDTITGFTKIIDYTSLPSWRFTLWRDNVTYPAGAATPVTAITVTTSVALNHFAWFVEVYDIGGYLHLDLDTDGCYKIMSAGSGHYLQLAADGSIQRVTGTEGATGLILAPDGIVKVKGV